MQELLSKPIFSIGENFDVTLSQLLLAILFVIIAALLSHYVAKLITKKVLAKFKLAEDNLVIFKRLIFFVFLGIITVTTLSFFNIPLTAFAFISGAVAIGAGFGAKTVMDNFISGWILMSERPLRINDIIEFEDHLGRVIEVGNRSTMIRRIDGAHMVVPNSSLLQANLINWTLVDPNIRTSVRVGVEYGSDVSKVKEILEKVMKEHESVIDDPEPMVIFEDFADSSLLFELWFWAKVGAVRELRTIRSDIRFKINKEFQEAGIVIAFPQRDLHFKFAEGKGFPVTLSHPGDSSNKDGD
ncbi:mechanosensitive ion channel family protein [Kangiella sediminilitoris]|uniref:MscS Mechanosensitive ion channel n=1 Tax=Kangiella sediminilitoris TaxID=1144748 RepID=A0A1B3BAJ7_9GAMM|nr:mechanosensitive ion channel domain-containing protein [Kangiella sediminilitoris]AOE49828.1 MscS Mechanosensitive ion channel [Kangiella sediminilitoris]